MPALDTVAALRRLPVLPTGVPAPAAGALRDTHGRTVRYVRLSVTDRCDLACVYCMPPEGERVHARHAELLTPAEIARLARVFADRGASRLRFTGGEPLCRKDIVAIVEGCRIAAPRLALALTTNGTRLAALAGPLAMAGLGSVNVSVDSLDRARFLEITRGGDLSAVLAGVDAAQAAGLEVKSNTVVLGDRSLDEIPRIVAWAWSRGIVPRFIEVMPIGEAAQLDPSAFVPAAAILERLAPLVRETPARAARPAHGPARYLEARDGSACRVGLIAATTERFCDSCNRVRVTATGTLRPCLARPEGELLGDLARAGATDAELGAQLERALRAKSEGHVFGCGSGPHQAVGMSLVGG